MSHKDPDTLVALMEFLTFKASVFTGEGKLLYLQFLSCKHHVKVGSKDLTTLPYPLSPKAAV